MSPWVFNANVDGVMKVVENYDGCNKGVCNFVRLLYVGLIMPASLYGSETMAWREFKEPKVCKY